MSSRFFAWFAVVSVGMFTLGTVGCIRPELQESEPDPFADEGDDEIVWYDDGLISPRHDVCFTAGKDDKLVEVPCESLACTGGRCCQMADSFEESPYPACP